MKRSFKALTFLMSSVMVFACFPLISGQSVASADGTGALAAYQYKESIYSPQTSLKDAPTVIWKADSADSKTLLETCEAAIRPQVVEISIKATDAADPATIDVLSADGKTDYSMNLYAFLTQTEFYAIPALRIGKDDSTTVAALKLFASKYTLEDAYVICSDADTLYSVTSTTTYIQGVLDFSSVTSIAAGDLSECEYAVNETQAKIVLFSENVVSKQEVSFLRSRMVTVWTDTTQSSANATLYNQVLAAPNAIVCSDETAVYEVLASFTTTNSLLDTPAVVGHQGTTKTTVSGFPANSLGAYSWALGEGADGVELDVWYLNGKLLVTHNKPTTTTGYMQLSQVLAAYQNTDTLLHIELKLDSTDLSSTEQASFSPGFIAALATTLAAYPDAKDNVVFISFYRSLITAIENSPDMSWAPRAYLSTLSTSDAYKYLEEWNASYDPAYTAPVTSSSILADMQGMRERGLTIGYWTADDAQEDVFMTREAASLTTNTADRSTNYATEVNFSSSLTKNAGILYAGCDTTNNEMELNLSSLVSVKEQNGTLVSSPALKLVSLDGRVQSTASAGVYSMESGCTEALVMVSYTQTMKNGTAYTIYSAPITLKSVSVTSADKVSVTWKNAGGSQTLATENYYVTEASSDGATPALSPTPVYKKQNPAYAATTEKHYLFRGWQSSLDGKTYSADEIPALTVANKGTSVTYTAVYNAYNHVAGSAATCTKAQYCLVCGFVIKAALGHSYKAGICTRCGYVSSASKVTIKTPSAGKKKITVKWTAKSGAGGYRIKYRRAGTSKYTYVTVSASKVSYTLKKLTSKKSYQLLVQVYVKVSGKKVYGKWSSTKTIKAK